VKKTDELVEMPFRGADLWVLGRHALDRGVIGEYDGSISVAAMRPVATITAATR